MGQVVRARTPMHGKTSLVEHDGRGVFTGLTVGHLAAETFNFGAFASEADDRVLYDNATGNLYFDPAARRQAASHARDSSPAGPR